MSKSIEGKVALITGGNSGIGLATAQLFLQEGARVAISGRERKTLDIAQGKLGPESLVVKTDVSNLAQLDSLDRKSTRLNSSH